MQIRGSFCDIYLQVWSSSSLSMRSSISFRWTDVHACRSDACGCEYLYISSSLQFLCECQFFILFNWCEYLCIHADIRKNMTLNLGLLICDPRYVIDVWKFLQLWEWQLLISSLVSYLGEESLFSSITRSTYEGLMMKSSRGDNSLVGVFKAVHYPVFQGPVK